jgi:hypothetical protein
MGFFHGRAREGPLVRAVEPGSAFKGAEIRFYAIDHRFSPEPLF